jgi:exodeoxyribonuclease VII large subunit
MDPINVLNRGFTITRVNGQTVRSIHDLSKGDQISTETTDGTITSTVDETNP